MKLSENINLIKDITNIADELSKIYNLSNDITSDQINKDNIEDLGFTSKTFNEFENLGNKISNVMKLKSFLTSIGIDEKTIAQGIKFASKLLEVASKGRNSLDTNNNKTLKEIGLDDDMFSDISKAAKMFENISKPNNILKNIGDNSDLNTKNIISGLNKILKNKY